MTIASNCKTILEERLYLPPMPGGTYGDQVRYCLSFVLMHSHCLTCDLASGPVACVFLLAYAQTMFEQLVENCLRSEVYDMATGEWVYGQPPGSGH